MPANLWVNGVFLAFAVAQLFVFWYLFRRADLTRETDWRGGSVDQHTDQSTVQPTDRTPGPTVVCPDCCAENDGEYRFCRNCTSELPSATGNSSNRSSPARRGMF